MTGGGDHDGSPASAHGAPAGGRRVRRLALRVLFVQAVTLLVLWLLQAGFGIGAA